MGIVSGGSGGGGPTAGSYLPVALAGGGTLDTTTYDDTMVGSGKFHTLVLPNNRGALALARSGDAFPKLLLASTTSGLLSVTDGSADAWNNGLAIGVSTNLNGSFALNIGSFTAAGVDANGGAYFGAGSAAVQVGGYLIHTGTAPPTLGNLTFGGAVGDLYLMVDPNNIGAPPTIYLCTTAGNASTAIWTCYFVPGSPYRVITSGALPTVTITSGTGRQVSTTRDVETITPFTGDGTNNAATCAIALSSDNVTYSTLATISIAAALNLTGVLTDTVNCRVPVGWYIKLTAVHGTLGTTTYY